MRYDDILSEALSQAHALPRKPAPKPIAVKPQINLEHVIAKITDNLEVLSKVKEPLPQSIEITHDTAHLEALINKLGDLVAIAPTVNVSTPDNAILVDAINSSLPHRQLRKNLSHQQQRLLSSLPHRQLRKNTSL